MAFASAGDMRHSLMLALGIFIGQWLAFAAAPSPASFHTLGLAAWERRDYAEALRHWSHGVAFQPANPLLHYRRATALARLGQAQAAADAYRLVLLLEPPIEIARLAQEGLAGLDGAAARALGAETTVPVEPSRGVWVTTVVLNGQRAARFIVDTGSSFTIVAPALATALSLPTRGARGAIELQTLAGQTAGAATTLASLRVGSAERRDVSVVIHDPGAEIDGILGNTFLAHYRLTLDADRHQLHLRPAALD